ncbi:DUF998 domain-containing protein [Kocuria turfanensis]|uniref:DUF998 domain-containing protein n=1 Tax=Kocuria turfanensis TaxID=388357 RepID=A0A512ID82_9MICC|nr:DUF998 domain-containing protein [Kocuria turfanensis]GEO95649.1 hypothetical protein KTU01_17720 [Kocuria turfanensis]
MRTPPSRRQVTAARTAGAARWNVVRKALLAAGPLSSALYVIATDVVGAARWDHYHRAQRMVSDLFAVGSPARPVLNDLMKAYTALTVAFGAGVWASAGTQRALRVSGGMLAGYGVSNIVAGFFPLELDDDASVPMHVVVTNAQLVLMLGAMGSAAAGLHGRLRGYCIASLITSVAMGAGAFAAAPRGPSLVLGVGERISIGAFLLWTAVLAVALWRSPGAGNRSGGTPYVTG